MLIQNVIFNLGRLFLHASCRPEIPYLPYMLLSSLELAFLKRVFGFKFQTVPDVMLSGLNPSGDGAPVTGVTVATCNSFLSSLVETFNVTAAIDLAMSEFVPR